MHDSGRANSTHRAGGLQLDPAKVDARRKANGGRFSPSDASNLQEATGAIVIEADTLEQLIALMKTGSVPVR